MVKCKVCGKEADITWKTANGVESGECSRCSIRDQVVNRLESECVREGAIECPKCGCHIPHIPTGMLFKSSVDIICDHCDEYLTVDVTVQFKSRIKVSDEEIEDEIDKELEGRE